MDVPATCAAPEQWSAVLDTNILVACALAGDRVPRRYDAIRRCVELTRAARGLVASPETLAELNSVLMRQDFDRYAPAEQRRRFVEAITAECRIVRPDNVERLCRDPEDDMFLAAALAGRVRWLVTVDRQLLSVRTIGSARILRPERFLEAVAALPV